MELFEPVPAVCLYAWHVNTRDSIYIIPKEFCSVKAFILNVLCLISSKLYDLYTHSRGVYIIYVSAISAIPF